jgi:uncharacterized membrane protein YgcG
MRRALSALAAGALVALSLIGGAGAASAVAPDAPHAVDVLPADAVPTTVGVLPADVNDFSFDSFSADYYLDVDADGRSILTTVETFVAVFPDFDQNHGMRRAIPEKYQGAPTDISVLSVTDENGDPRPYEVESDDEGFLLITSADPGFVHGAQTYVFTYTQHNVTRFFPDTNDDEFYWDTNGTGWGQSFGTVTARVHVPTGLATALTGQAACYRGYEGSSETCEILTEETADGTILSASVSELSAYQNMTLAIGFAPHTFVERDASYLGSPFAILQILSVLAGIVAAIWAIVLRVTRLADGRGRPTVIAEYTPPDGMDLFTASVILKKTKKGAAASFVDLAVNRRIRIVETPATGWFARGVTYLLELVDASGLQGAPLNLVYALFGYQLLPGTGYLMSGKDTTLSESVRGIILSATSAAGTNGLRKKGSAKYSILPMLLVILAGTGSIVFGAIMLDNASGGLVPFAMFVPPIIAALIVFGLVFRTPLTDKGAELRDHLKGLELYIRLAEADRLRMLQSPTGAEKVAISTSDPREVVKIYEKLLPYAVLFDLEKDWAKELGKYYVDESPDWYSGTTAFNAALFASSISSMSSSVASSYSGSSSSSSSGGSGGGGSSGGGGGGGGGGGV